MEIKYGDKRPDEVNVFKVLGISEESDKEEVMEKALALYESARVIPIDEWNAISKKLSNLGVEWAPRPIKKYNLSVEKKSLGKLINGIKCNRFVSVKPVQYKKVK